MNKIEKSIIGIIRDYKKELAACKFWQFKKKSQLRGRIERARQFLYSQQCINKK